MSDEPGVPGEQSLAQRLRGVIAAKDEQITALSSALDASVDRVRRMELRIAELERRLSMDGSVSGTPSSKEGTGAKAERKAREKKDRQESQRGGSRAAKAGGQPAATGRARNRTAYPP